MKVNLKTKEAEDKALKLKIERIDRLREMHEAMQESMQNAAKVKEQQIDLVAILEVQAPEKFKDFIEQTKKASEEMAAQVVELSRRVDVLGGVIEKLDASEEIKDVVNDMLDALGVFGK